MPVPIFLIANPRSGTHLLRGFLRGGGDVEDLGEVFNPESMRGHPQDFFRFLADRMASDPGLAMPFRDQRERLFDAYMAHVMGLTSKPYLLIDVKYDGVHHFNNVWHHVDAPPRLFALIGARGYPVIHLVRRNALEAHCSTLLAHATRRWSRPSENAGPPIVERTIRVDVANLVTDLERMQTRTNFFAWNLRNHAPIARLFYEELLDDGNISPGVHDAISDLLGQPLDMPRVPAYAKISPPLRDYVENYADVIRALAGTRFLTMIS